MNHKEQNHQRNESQGPQPPTKLITRTKTTNEINRKEQKDQRNKSQGAKPPTK